MAEAVEQKILEELESVKAKLIEVDKEVHNLREEFAETHLSEAERGMLAAALKEELEGKTISLEEIEKRLK